MEGAMTLPKTYKPYRCRFCRHILPTSLSVPQGTNGAVLLGPLSQRHPTDVSHSLDQMRGTEDMA
jgi:hypothetical protein